MDLIVDAVEQQQLLRLARAAIENRLLGKPIPAPDSRWQRVAAAFVTLRDEGQLRGCIGYLETDRRLAEVVTRCAVAASTSDPRFPSVGAEELPRLRIEISVLGPIEPTSSPTDFEVGRHGLIVRRGVHRGLLLPQVALECEWDRETFLTQTCLKAGLPGDAWKAGAQVFRFEADVFSEQEPAALPATLSMFGDS